MKVSIIVPSFNQARFLPATLDSILQQSDVDFEVHVYDGGSTDGSVEVLQKYADRIWWTSGPDGGQADAINRGLRETNGDIVAYLNSDDVYYPNTLQTVVRHFVEHPACQALYGEADHLHDDGAILERYYTEPWNYLRLFEVCFLCQPAVFWRRGVVERFGFFDDTLHFALDYDYWLRIGRHIDFHHLPGVVLAGSRLHAETKTLGQRVRVHREILDVIIRHRGPSKAVLGWLGHLAHHEASELALEAGPANASNRAVHFVASFLHNAACRNLRVPPDKIAELDAALASAGA